MATVATLNASDASMSRSSTLGAPIHLISGNDAFPPSPSPMPSSASRPTTMNSMTCTPTRLGPGRLRRPLGSVKKDATLKQSLFGSAQKDSSAVAGPSTTTPTSQVKSRGDSAEDDTASTPSMRTRTTSGGLGSSASNAYRLLYRGALSIPDSYLVLDGITFQARLHPEKGAGGSSTTPSSSSKPTTAVTEETLGTPSGGTSSSSAAVFALLENPLALALESMRGRPSLRFVGNVPLKDVYLDESGGVELDIHPSAIITRIYFENMFSILPISSRTGRSELGVKVVLGDTDGPEITEIVIFAQTNATSSSPDKSASSSSSTQLPIHLRVARLTTPPPDPTSVKRPPRPDDILPRKPPPHFFRPPKRTNSLASLGVIPISSSTSGSSSLKRTASNAAGLLPIPGSSSQQQSSKRQKLVADLGSDVRLGTNAPGVVDEGGFKVPELPVKSVNAKSIKGKAKEAEMDVFGDVTEVGNVSGAPDVGSTVPAPVAPTPTPKVKSAEERLADELEKANKNVIKRSTVDYLAKTKDPATKALLDRSHPEFKDMYNHISRGIGFALRNKLRTCAIDPDVVIRLAEKHGALYLGGLGPAVSSSSRG